MRYQANSNIIYSKVANCLIKAYYKRDYYRADVTAAQARAQEDVKHAFSRCVGHCMNSNAGYAGDDF